MIRRPRGRGTLPGCVFAARDLAVYAAPWLRQQLDVSTGLQSLIDCAAPSRCRSSGRATCLPLQAGLIRPSPASSPGQPGALKRLLVFPGQSSIPAATTGGVWRGPFQAVACVGKTSSTMPFSYHSDAGFITMMGIGRPCARLSRGWILAGVGNTGDQQAQAIVCLGRPAISARPTLKILLDRF